MAIKFTPLVIQDKSPRPLKIGLFGGADSGKTFTALTMAKALGGKWAMLDTDGGRVAEYAKDFGTEKWLDVYIMSNEDRFDPVRYGESMDYVEEGNYDGFIIDTFSIFWLGVWDHVQDYAEELAKKYHKEQPMMIQAWAGKKGGNKQFYSVMHRIPTFPSHMIVTMQEKLEFVSEGGSLKPTGQKLPVFRGGSKYMYEFTLFGWLERNKAGKKRLLTFDKTATCHELENRSFENPGREVIEIIAKWRGIKLEKNSR